MTLSTTAARHDTVNHRLPGCRAVLEEQWRWQVAELVTLSYEFFTPTAERGAQSRSEELQIAARRIAGARQQLDEIEAALARVDDGSYGRCGSCQTPIEGERLEVLPSARYCRACCPGVRWDRPVDD